MFLTLNQETFLCIPLSAAATAVNPNGIKAILSNRLSTSFLKGIQDFGNGPRSLSRYPPDFTNLESGTFDKFILSD